MSLKTLVSTFDKKKIPGIKSIKKYPSLDMDTFKSYGKLFLQKFFIDTGTKPNKMVSFGAKDKSFSNPIVFIVYDLKMQPAIFFEFKDDFDEEKFLKFVGEFYKKGKFTIPKKSIKEAVSGDAVQAIVSGIMGVFSLLLLASYYFMSVKYAAEEYYVNTAVENELNKQLFSAQQKNENGFEIFTNLENYINIVIDKKMNSLILCGPPGMSKTYMVRRTLYFARKVPGKDYKIEKGSAMGLKSVYQLLYDNSNKLIVLDDFDTPLANEDIVNLIKAITDSYGKRIVSLSPDKVMSSDSSSRGAAPNKFEFTGQVIIITNKKKEDLDLALRSRSPVVEVSFNTKEVIKAMDKLLVFIAPQVDYNVKSEVFNYIKILQKNDPKINVSFRSVKAAIDSRVGNPADWKEMVRLIVDYKGKTVKETIKSDALLRMYRNEKK